MSLNDVRAFDVRTGGWRELETDVHPAHGAGGTAAYDAESDGIIVYFTAVLDASAERGLARISETWAFDVARRRWTNMQPDPAPFGLMEARMVYDAAADRIVLFGGADFTREPAPRFDETWAYEFNSNSWVRRRSGQEPPGRSYYGMAYDAQADKTLMVGGTLADEVEDRAGEMGVRLLLECLGTARIHRRCSFRPSSVHGLCRRPEQDAVEAVVELFDAMDMPAVHRVVVGHLIQEGRRDVGRATGAAA